MEQTKLESLIETITDISFGFLVSWGVVLWVVPIMYPEYAPSGSVGFGVVCIFTVSSFSRRYFIRRFFARRLHLILQQVLKRVFQ